MGVLKIAVIAAAAAGGVFAALAIIGLAYMAYDDPAAAGDRAIAAATSAEQVAAAERAVVAEQSAIAAAAMAEVRLDWEPDSTDAIESAFYEAFEAKQALDAEADILADLGDRDGAIAARIAAAEHGAAAARAASQIHSIFIEMSDYARGAADMSRDVAAKYKAAAADWAAAGDRERAADMSMVAAVWSESADDSDTWMANIDEAADEWAEAAMIASTVNG